MRSVLFLSNKLTVDERSFGSFQTMGMADGIWREPFAHPVRSLIHVTQQV